MAIRRRGRHSRHWTIWTVSERGSIRVSGAAEDATSTLSRLEVAFDGEDWRPVSPEGGFTDSRHLEFHTVLPGLEPGGHSVGVRAVDAAGNAVTRAARVTLPPR